MKRTNHNLAPTGADGRQTQAQGDALGDHFFMENGGGAMAVQKRGEGAMAVHKSGEDASSSQQRRGEATITQPPRGGGAK